MKKFRAASKSAPTRKLAETPTRFHVENMPFRGYAVIAKKRRSAAGLFPWAGVTITLCSDLLFVLPSATRYHFGVLTSTMHNAWVRYTQAG